MNAKSKYLTNEQLLEKLNRIEEVAAKLDAHIHDDECAHEKLRDDLIHIIESDEQEMHEIKERLIKLYNKYFAAKRCFDK